MVGLCVFLLVELSVVLEVRQIHFDHICRLLLKQLKKYLCPSGKKEAALGKDY